MRQFLKETFNTDRIQNVEMDELKKAINGEHMINRLQYRKAVGNMIKGNKPVVKKGEVMRKEMNLAQHLNEKERHPEFGFQCLHYAVSESSQFLNVKILNKMKKPSRVGIRTVEIEDGAKSGKDFDPVDEVMEFVKEDFKLMQITIKDDD